MAIIRCWQPAITPAGSRWPGCCAAARPEQHRRGSPGSDHPHLSHRHHRPLRSAGGTGVVCPYPRLAGLCAPAPAYAATRLHGYTAGMTAATITFCPPESARNGVTVHDPGRRPAGRIRSHASPAGAARDGRADQRVPKNPYQGYSDPRRCDRAADQTGRLIADASILAAWAAARTSKRASVTLAPLVPDRTITPHAADTGQMTRRSSPIASPGTISGSRPAGPTETPDLGC